MTEQEYNDIKKRYEDYSQLKYKAQKLNVIRREIESLGLYQIGVKLKALDYIRLLWDKAILSTI